MLKLFVLIIFFVENVQTFMENFTTSLRRKCLIIDIKRDYFI